MTSGPLRTCHLTLLCGALAIAAPTAAVPAVSQALGMGPALTQWFAAGYQLSSGPLQLCAGHLADRHGARRTLLAALAVFTGGSLLAATAGQGTGLLAARLLQGVGGSALSPLSLSLLLALSPAKDDERRAVGAWTATAATASCLGPLLGGLLTNVLGWRAIFGALALLAAVTAGCALALLPGRAQHHVPLEGRLDTTGIALCTATATTVLIALTATAAGAPPPVLPTAVGAAAVLLAALLRRARHRADFVLDGELLRRPETRRALFVLPVLFCGNSLFTFLMYFELTRAHGLSPFRAALVTLPAVTPAVFTGRWAARHTRGPGDGAPLTRTGLLCLAAGLLTGGLGRDGPTPLWLVGVSCALVGCGLGLANGAAMATVTRDRPLHTASRATATATTFAMLGGAAGPALAGALTTSLPHLPLLVTALTTAVASLALTRTARPRTAAEEPPGRGPGGFDGAPFPAVVRRGKQDSNMMCRAAPGTPPTGPGPGPWRDGGSRHRSTPARGRRPLGQTRDPAERDHHRRHLHLNPSRPLRGQAPETPEGPGAQRGNLATFRRVSDVSGQKAQGTRCCTNPRTLGPPLPGLPVPSATAGRMLQPAEQCETPRERQLQALCLPARRVTCGWLEPWRCSRPLCRCGSFDSFLLLPRLTHLSPLACHAVGDRPCLLAALHLVLCDECLQCVAHYGRLHRTRRVSSAHALGDVGN